MGDQASFSSFHTDIGIPINYQEESGIVTFWSTELLVPLKLSSDMRTLSRWDGQLGLSLVSPHRIHTSLHLVRWKTSLHSSHCREIRRSFESGHLGIHSTSRCKVRVPLTYLLLREGSSWGACGKLAYLFNRILEIRSFLETISGAWSFPRVAVLKFMFL